MFKTIVGTCSPVDYTGSTMEHIYMELIVDEDERNITI